MRGSWLSEWLKAYIFCLRIGADAGESLVSMKLRNAEATAPGYSWNIGPRDQMVSMRIRESIAYLLVGNPMWPNPEGHQFSEETRLSSRPHLQNIDTSDVNQSQRLRIVIQTPNSVFQCFPRFVIEPDRHHKKHMMSLLSCSFGASAPHRVANVLYCRPKKAVAWKLENPWKHWVETSEILRHARKHKKNMLLRTRRCFFWILKAKKWEMTRYNERMKQYFVGCCSRITILGYGTKPQCRKTCKNFICKKLISKYSTGLLPHHVSRVQNCTCHPIMVQSSQMTNSW